MNNNEAVEAFATRLAGTYARHGLPNPGVVRLYPLEREVKAMIKSEASRDPGPEKNLNWKKEAADYREATAENDVDTAADAFLATYRMFEITVDVRTEHDERRQRRRHCQDMSLHRAALEYYLEHRDEPRYEFLRAAIEAAHGEAAGETKSRTDGETGQEADGKARDDAAESTLTLEAAIKILYGEFLAQFRGTIVTTPVAAADATVRGNFKPALVLMDEAARMRELTSLIGIAFYSPLAWIFTGDPMQSPPHINVEHDLKNGTLTSNPFAPTLTNSTLSRAVAGGAVKSYLRISHRLLGNLIMLPNRTSYTSMIRRPPRPPVGLSDSLAPFQQILAGMNPTQPKNDFRLLVEFPGSTTDKVGTSTLNHTHVSWVITQVSHILGRENLHGVGSNSGNPVTVLVVAMYKAQVLQYLDAAHRRGLDMRRLKIKTLDSAQGDEADIVIGDFVGVHGPGFTAEPFRTALITTRARALNVTILNRGMFVGFESRGTVTRARHLARVYKFHTSIVRVTWCPDCETGTHTALECPRPKGMPPTDCKEAFCENCFKRGDHGTNECPEPILCARCREPGHPSQLCEAEFGKCVTCGGGHATRACRKCRWCDEVKDSDHNDRTCSRSPFCPSSRRRRRRRMGGG